MLRKEAIKLGLKRYFNGVPCVRGHIAERLVKGSCLVCDRVDTLARNRRNAEHLAASSRAYRKANPEKVKSAYVSYRARNPEKVKAWKSASQKRHRGAANKRQQRYHVTHREQINARIAAWQKANPEKELAKVRRRQAAKLRRMPIWADQQAMDAVYRAAQIAKVTWPDVEIHVDHVVPLQGRLVSGLHVHDNLRIIRAEANRSKSNHF